MYKGFQGYRQRVLQVVIFLVVLVLALVFFYERAETSESFAACLSDRGTVMYGTDWCPHCANQKKMFGQTFAGINYVNCDFNRDLCLEKGVTKYPWWFVNNDPLTAGVKTFAELAEAADCRIPTVTDSEL